MKKDENARARKLAHAHAQKISIGLEGLLYFIYQFLFDDYSETYNRKVEKHNYDSIGEESLNDKEQCKEPPINVVALFIGADKGVAIHEYLSVNNKLDSSIMRDLYIATDYMWSGTLQSADCERILKLMENPREKSDVPQRDFFVVIIPIDKATMKCAILKNDMANRISFFESICQLTPSIRISNRISYEKLPKSIIYMKS